MIHESGFITISVHLTKEGAEKAIAFHKMEKMREWEELFGNNNDEFVEFGEFEDWQIEEIELQP
jgi:hypothetical protein